VAKVDIPSSVSYGIVSPGRAASLTAKHGAGSDSFAKALGAVVEGVTFFELAQVAVADTRVKVAFEALARRKRAQLTKLEAIAGPTAKDASTPAGIYPLDAVSKVECYVCGYVTETRAMPNQCPKCGTARYTFEKEIALTKAWEIAGDTARREAALFQDAAAHASGPAQKTLADLARDDEGLAAEAGKELAELRS
jgi:rubrerythrin